MPLTTSHDVAQAAIVDALRNAGVAAAAGVSSGAWASTASPRVMVGDGAGYVRGLHRGRLPAIEAWEAPATWEHQTADGGTIGSVWRFRVHVNGATWSAADSLAHGIAQIGLAAIRAVAYLREGSEVIGPLLASPLGFALEVELTLSHVYCRQTYETDGTVEPGGGLSGTTFLLNWDDATPVEIYDMPDTEALDNVEVEILTAFDGTTPVLEIGTTADPDAYLEAIDSDLTMAGATFERDHAVLGPSSIKATLTLSGATQGSLRVQITTTRKGT